MNDLNGQIVPDTSTAVPNLSTNAEHPASTMEYQLWEQLREVKEENLALRAVMTKLEAENAELRKKCMTRFERIKNASAEELASTLMHIYMDGYADGVGRVSRESNDTYWLDWLQEIGKI